jgi:hypothetical protein
MIEKKAETETGKKRDHRDSMRAAVHSLDLSRELSENGRTADECSLYRLHAWQHNITHATLRLRQLRQK